MKSALLALIAFTAYIIVANCAVNYFIDKLRDWQ